MYITYKSPLYIPYISLIHHPYISLTCILYIPPSYIPCMYIPYIPPLYVPYIHNPYIPPLYLPYIPGLPYPVTCSATLPCAGDEAEDEAGDETDAGGPASDTPPPSPQAGLGRLWWEAAAVRLDRVDRPDWSFAVAVAPFVKNYDHVRKI